MIPLYSIYFDGLWADNKEEKPNENHLTKKTVADCMNAQKIK
jgi:hypothetical protein